jgi:hypothetical protein
MYEIDTCMAIDATTTGLLEQYIDSMVIAIPNIVRVFLRLQRKHSCKFKMRRILHWG